MASCIWRWHTHRPGRGPRRRSCCKPCGATTAWRTWRAFGCCRRTAAPLRRSAAADSMKREASLSNAALMARRRAVIARGVGQVHEIFVDRAHDCEVWDVEGRRYIDFAGGIGVLNTGHRHPKVLAAVDVQLEKFTHTCFQVVPYPGYVELAEQLNEITPGRFPKRTSLFSTGAEAIENAVKIARAATG